MPKQSISLNFVPTGTRNATVSPPQAPPRAPPAQRQSATRPAPAAPRPSTQPQPQQTQPAPSSIQRAPPRPRTVVPQQLQQQQQQQQFVSVSSRSAPRPPPPQQQQPPQYASTMSQPPQPLQLQVQQQQPAVPLADAYSSLYSQQLPQPMFTPAASAPPQAQAAPWAMQPAGVCVQPPAQPSPQVTDHVNRLQQKLMSLQQAMPPMPHEYPTVVDDESETEEEVTPKPRPVRRRDVPVLPARYTRHCSGECGPGQLAVYDVHRQTVGGAAHKVEAVRAAHVDPCAGTAGELFAGLVPEQEKADVQNADPSAPNDTSVPQNDQDSQGNTPAEAEDAAPPTHVVATVYHRPGRGFPLLPQRRVVAPTAEAAADIAVSAAGTAEGTGQAAVAVYGRLTDAELEETTGAAYENVDINALRNPFTGEFRQAPPSAYGDSDYATWGGYGQAVPVPAASGYIGGKGQPTLFSVPAASSYLSAPQTAPEVPVAKSRFIPLRNDQARSSRPMPARPVPVTSASSASDLLSAIQHTL